MFIVNFAATIGLLSKQKKLRIHLKIMHIFMTIYTIGQVIFNIDKLFDDY